MAPATNSETAARRRMRRTRMWSAATSGAGGHDAPPGQLAASSAWTSAALERPLTTVSAVTSRSPMVASGRSASASSRRTCSSAPVSISRVDSWRWCRNVGGSPRRPRCSCTTSEVAPGQAKKPGIEVGQLGHERAADDDARGPGLDGGPGGVECVLARPARAARARSAGCPKGRRPRAPGGPRRRAPARCRAT